ncbi:MAG: TRAM domain-containing protein [Acidimicrobiales bacterium]|nr:TRAM domain-containing protein [Acidimicrobiales bacterium]
MDERAGEVAILDVTAVVAGGEGLARDADGRVTFVAGALPGEQVRVAIRQRKKDFARATVLEVLRPSVERVGEACRFVAEGCGGCDWQHVAPGAQRRLKAEVVADALRRQAHLEIEVGLGPELPADGYRTTVRGVSVDGRFGFRTRKTHDAVAVGPCLVAHPVLHEVIAEGSFPAGDIVLRAGARTSERLAIVAGQGTGVVVPEGVRVVSDHELRHGRRAWYHEEAAGRRWRVSARSFFQARPDGADALVDAVRNAVGAEPRGHLVDLYGGVGLFAGSVEGFEHVTLVEQSRSSVADAKVNLADRSPRIIQADVAHWGTARADVVVADPPRTGLGPPGVRAVTNTQADRVVLVSCDPAALGRDAKLLGTAGYRLHEATLIDLFPHTSHVEVVSRFDRG